MFKYINRLLMGRFGLNCEIKCRTLANLTLDPYFPTHHLNELLAYDQAKASTAVSACSRSIYLAERLE